MAKKKEIEAIETAEKVEEKIPMYKGTQLLKDDKYNNRVARIVLEADKYYSLEEADAAINNYLRKKG